MKTIKKKYKVPFFFNFSFLKSCYSDVQKYIKSCLVEIDNAIGNAKREILNRYDFKGSDTSIERKENEVTIVTDDELKLNQVHDLIITHLVRRKVDPKNFTRASNLL